MPATHATHDVNSINVIREICYHGFNVSHHFNVSHRCNVTATSLQRISLSYPLQRRLLITATNASNDCTRIGLAPRLNTSTPGSLSPPPLISSSSLSSSLPPSPPRPGVRTSILVFLLFLCLALSLSLWLACIPARLLAVARGIRLQRRPRFISPDIFSVPVPVPVPVSVSLHLFFYVRLCMCAGAFVCRRVSVCVCEKETVYIFV